MNLFRRIGAVLLLASPVAMGFSQVSEFAPREVLVKFRGTEAASNYYAANANRAINAQSIGKISRLNVTKVKVPAGMALNDAIAYYNGLPTVEYAEGNPKRYKTYVPNDPRWSMQYGQRNVKGPEAWNLTKGSANVIIAIIDDGIAATHEDLDSKKVPGYDYSDNDNDPTTTEDHGTHCAGIAAAATDNGKGVAGTGFNCRIMPLKIFPNSFASVSAQAIIHAADNGAKVISMSYGGYGENITERNAVNYAWGKGVVLLGATGNDGVQTPSFPAAHQNVIAVGSTGVTDTRSNFSNYGPSWADVAAPGEDIESTVNGGYAQFTGTSMACPMAAGVVGLLWSFAQPGTTATQIRAALENNTDPISNGGFAKGRVNAFKALSSLDPGSADISAAAAASMWTGAGSSGSFTDLTTSDANFFTVTTQGTSLGQVGGAVVDFSLTGSPSGLREALAYIEANGATGSSGQFYLWDYTTSKYVLIKAFALKPSGVKREKIILPLNLTKYVSGGNIRAGIRAIGPHRNPRNWNEGAFDFKVGFVQIATRPNL